jgi:hypothetical protein
MKAIQIRMTGGRETLELRELPDPVPNKDMDLESRKTTGKLFLAIGDET